MRKIYVLLISITLIIALSACNVSENDYGNGGYTVTWKHEDGRILEIDEDVKEGSMPSYDGTDPVLRETNEYSFSFIGWSPSIGVVYGNQTYTALFYAVSKSINISINSSNWGQYFRFSVNLNNINSNDYTNIVLERLTVSYTPLYGYLNSTTSTNITIFGYVDVKLGYTTDNYSNINVKYYKVYFTHFLYKSNGYYGDYSVSLYHNTGTSSLSTYSWVINVEAYLTTTSGTISLPN